jgi:outer membrane protein OmpA-like peptidoglycan-associated protein
MSSRPGSSLPARVRRSARWTLAGSIMLAGACAHTPPQELVAARDAYGEAEGGVAKEQAPAQLHAAHTALEEAERSFSRDGDSEHTRDLSYVALRKAQLAAVQGRITADRSKLQELEASSQQRQRAALVDLRDKYESQQQQLEHSQAALEDAKRRADQATADLARIASVKQDARGTVITLSGEVLFTSDKAELLPTAEAKLSEVARALTQQNRDARIVVEGHTDSQGSESYNLELSMKRAEAVRDYLASHGVAADRISAKGMGEAQPVGQNSTPHGRANNRRVEIVVQPVGAQSAS